MVLRYVIMWIELPYNVTQCYHNSFKRVWCKEGQMPSKFYSSFWVNQQVQKYGYTLAYLMSNSVTRFGDLLNFGQIFKAYGNN